MSDTSIELWHRFQSSDPWATEVLFRRYLGRLIALADSRLSRKLASRFDAEDVVQSAYRSFFVRAGRGEFSIQESGDLWRLLATMTIRKLQGQVEHHRARKRSYDRDQPFPAVDGDGWDEHELAAAGPAASEVVAAAELIDLVMAELEPAQAQAVQMRLQDFTLPEIASALHCSERTVRRWLHAAKQLLEAQLHAADTRGPRELQDSQTTGTEELDTSLCHEDYLLQRHIGSGGMGRVYSAIEKRTGRTFAIKVIKKSRLSDPNAVVRFRQEARVLSRLRHPGIIAMHGMGRMPGGGYFMTMDFIGGPSLDQIGSERTLTPRRAAEIVLAVAEAIAFAHGQDVIHCDLKPANVLLDDRGRAIVTDFGLARVLATEHEPIFIGGTAPFMAPEQIDAAWGSVDARTDVFALGGLLYFLISGKPPHEGTTRDATLDAVVQPEPVRSLVEDRADVPPGLAAITMRALAKHLRDRFPSAEEFASAIRAWINDHDHQSLL